MPDPSPAPQVLVALQPAVGDAVLSHSLVRVLHVQGSTDIDVLDAQWSSPIAIMMPEVREVVTHDIAHGELRLGKKWRLDRQALERGYAAAYVTQGAIKAALPPWFADISCRIGFLEHWRQLR